jgi:hypothetical protein
MRRVFTRIERAERVAKAQSKFSPDCLCFPTNEPPQIAFDIEFVFRSQIHPIGHYHHYLGRGGTNRNVRSRQSDNW